MILRTPTRTKTRSFNGTQMDFKFPSTESLPIDSIEEADLNNHHLLNVSLKKDDVSPHENNTDNASQILSDYTSASNTNSNTNTNTNSSNGYYSFANISDNTTSPRFLTENNDWALSVLNLNSNNPNHDYPSTLAPVKTLSSMASPLLNTQSSGNSLRNSITSKAKSQLQMESIPENNSASAHTATTSVPTADNISYDIISATSSAPAAERRMMSATSIATSTHSSTVVMKLSPTVKRHPMGLNKAPSVKYGESLRSSRLSSRQNAMSRASSLNSKKNHGSQLKRSNAIRCKGGLLAYFTTMGIKIRHKLRKLRIVIRKRLFSFYNSNTSTTPSAHTLNGRTTHISHGINSKVFSKKQKNGRKMNHSMSYSNDIKAGLTTSHLMRTDGYVSNLQRSVSQSSRKSSMHRPLTSLTPPASVTDSTSNNTARFKHRTTLRRTNSSIRRAASILTATPNTNRNSTISHVNDSNSIKDIVSTDNRSPRLTRSNGMSSLNSVIREPSIVVKNKVIPLYMGQYPIKEEDEYVIDTNSMTKLNSNKSLSSRESSYFAANDEQSSFYSSSKVEAKEEEEEEEEVDEEIKTKIENIDADKLSEICSQYYRQIISKRIMLRLQIGKYQESNNNDDIKGEYKELLDNLLSDNESDSSNLFDHDNDEIENSSERTDDSEDDDEDEDIEYQDKVPELKQYNQKGLNIQITSPFGVYSSASRNGSMLSIPVNTVKRSLTLPIGLKI